MTEWLLKLIPKDYKWTIAIRKVSYAMGKLAVTLLTYTKAQAIEQKLGIQVDPQVFQNAVAGGTIAALEWLHDYLKMHFPEVSWL